MTDSRRLLTRGALLAVAALALSVGGCGDDQAGEATSDTTDGSTSSDGSTSTSSGGSTTTEASAGPTGTAGETSGETTDATTDSPTTGGGMAVCGDGVVEGDEQCDVGEDNDDGGVCTTLCTLATCGDGFTGPGEGCDDGNDDPDDGCNNECALSSCGDGVLFGAEVCDDGNDDNTDACLDTCVEASCGDGYAYEGVEACDDGNAEDGDGCLTSCELASCGDGVVYEGVEGCDDANDVDNDECSNACVLAACDDGVQNGLESDVDCGGESCDACGDAAACGVDDDCLSGYCVDGACQTPRHCQDVYDFGETEDGKYTVDPDGADDQYGPVDVFCEMTFSDGGWTVIYNMMAKPPGNASAAEMYASITDFGPVQEVLPDSTSAAIYSQGLKLDDYTEIVWGWAPSSDEDVSRWGLKTIPGGLVGAPYVDTYPGNAVNISPITAYPENITKNDYRTGTDPNYPHVGMGFSGQVITWGYDLNTTQHGHWANWFTNKGCCTTGNNQEIADNPNWRYTIYIR